MRREATRSDRDANAMQGASNPGVEQQTCQSNCHDSWVLGNFGFLIPRRDVQTKTRQDFRQCWVLQDGFLFLKQSKQFLSWFSWLIDSNRRNWGSNSLRLVEGSHPCGRRCSSWSQPSHFFQAYQILSLTDLVNRKPDLAGNQTRNPVYWIKAIS